MVSLALAGAILVALPSMGPAVGAGLAAVVLLLGVAVAVRSWPVELGVSDDELSVRNPLRQIVVSRPDVRELRAERLAGRFGSPGTEVGIVCSDGRVVRVVASLAVPGTAHNRAVMFLALRRWSSANGVPDGLPHREYGDAVTRRSLLGSSEEVEVDAYVRRTDSRGWGGWEQGHLVIPSLPTKGAARWFSHVHQPVAVALGSPPRSFPIELRGADKVSVRPARFAAEAFFGDDTSFLVVTTIRRVLELALRAEEADLVLGRLRQMDGEDTAGLTPAE